MFFTGQKVVCVDDKPRRYPDVEVKVGVIYTIAAFNEVFPDAVHLVEVAYPRCFWADRFRPLVDRKTDISIFEHLLDPANHKQLEGV